MHGIILYSNNKRPLYMQIYDRFKAEIESGGMAHGEKLPSIRGLARELSVSKITVEMAYAQLLSEGYIENANRARYTVAAVERAAPAAAAPQAPEYDLPEPHAFVRYDFSSGEMDPEGFDFKLWRRYLSAALSDTPRLMRYGHKQGEPELRAEIARYIRASRGVTAHPGQIFIASGAQNLLSTLCILLKDDYGRVAFEEPGFKNGRRVFADHGCGVVPIDMESDGINIGKLSESGARLVYVSPSHQFPTGSIMSAGKRARLLSWAQSAEGLIIEDDYDSEFRYYGHPIPALKGLDDSGRVIYIGSFSKIMPPSIRISFMVLPHEQARMLREAPLLYNQSASTVEQLAMWRFMADGQAEKQIRRLRKRYQEKKQRFLAAVQRGFGDAVTVHDTGSGLFALLDLRTALSPAQLKERSDKLGCRVALVSDYFVAPPPQTDTKRLILYFSSIPVAETEQAVGLLKQAWS